MPDGIIDADRYTLADYANLAGLKGVEMNIVHTITDCMPIFDSAPLIKCNAGTINKTQVVTKYPMGQTRGYNMGTKAETAASKIVQDTTCMTESRHEIDRRIVLLNKNSAKWRMRADAAHIRGMAHKAAERIFNASLARDPLEFNGLAVRYNKINDCVIDAGGTGSDLTDIWLINWGADTVHLIYPEGGFAGITTEFEPNVDAVDANGGVYKADRTWFRWDMGLAVEDPMQVIRIANVSKAKLADGSTDLTKLMIEASERMPEEVSAGCSYYMTRSVRTMLRQQILAKPNVQLEFKTVAGKRVQSFDDIAVQKVPDFIIPTYKSKLTK